MEILITALVILIQAFLISLIFFKLEDVTDYIMRFTCKMLGLNCEKREKK